MLTLENFLSPQIIQRIGWMLMHFTWQATAVAMVLAILLRILRRFSVNLRYIVACMGLLLIVLIPALTFGLIKVSTPVAPVHTESVIEPVVTAYEAAAEAPALAQNDTFKNTLPETAYRKSGPNYKQKFVSFLEPKLDIIVALWLLGVFALSIWHLGGWTQLHRLRRRMVRPVDESLRNKLKELSGILGIHRVVELMESALVQAPTAIGWLKPVILLPSSALTGLSPEQLEGILAHELAHIKRYDYLINILQTVVETLGFYHPAVWWISKKIRVERENCCDDIAVNLTGDRIGYAKTLASFEEIQAGRPELAVAATGGCLFSRISRLLGKDSSKKTFFSLIPAATDIILVATLVILISNVAFCSAGQAPLQEIHCSGKVMDYEVNPVGQAEVYLFEIHYAYAEGRIIYKPLGQTVTDSQGNYVLDVQAVRSDNILIVAYKPGLALSYEKAANPGTHLEFLLRLGKPDIFSGTVLNQDKEPITNAKLQLRLKSEMDRTSGISIPSLEQLFITTTDTQGHFSFSHVPERSTADFFVEAPGQAATWTFWEGTTSQFPAGREDIEIVLKDESRIEGRVIDEDTGQGVPGVTLLARSDRGMDNYHCCNRTVSNQEGHFELAGLQSDNYSIQVVAKYEEMPDWVGKDVKVTIESGQTKQNIEIQVSKGSIIEITLISESTGEPLESALANVSQSANFGRHPCYYKSNYSEENGVAIFRVPQGECRVYAGGNRYVYFPDPEPINAVRGQVHKREIVLVDKSSVSGIVIDQNGEPVENVLVTSKPVCEQSARTDSQGRFEVKWYLHPMYSSEKWLLLAQDFENCRAGLVEITEETETQNITLRPAYTLSGQVTDPNGIGIPMASVKLMGRLPGWITNIGNKAFTDQQGRYEIKAIPAQIPDLTFRLEIGANSYSFVSDIDARLEGNPNIPIEITPVTLQPKDQTLSGIVVDANEEPVVGIDVLLSSGVIGEPIISTATDDQGRFFFDRVKRGSLRIQAGMGGGPVDLGFMEAQGGDKDIKVILGQRLVHIPSQSLIDKPLRDISELGIELEDAADKSILLCFFDYQQRPSRNYILQLKEQIENLREKEVEVVAVQAEKIDEETFNNWCEGQNLSFPIGVIETDQEKTKLTWGVQSLPWLILTDEQHNVIAEGFSLNELDEKIR